MKFLIYIAAILILSVVLIGIPFRNVIYVFFLLHSPAIYLSMLIGLILLVLIVIRLALWN